MLKSKSLSNSFMGWNTFSNFDFNMMLILGLAIFNVLYKVKISPDKIYLASNLWNPTALLFGPLLYWSVRANFEMENKNIRWHLVPFFITLAFYIAALSSNGHSDTYGLYQMISWAFPLSMFAYSINILTSGRGFTSVDGPRPELLVLIYMSLLIIAIIATMIYLCELLDIDMGIDYRFFTHSLLLAIAIFILRYFFWSNKGNAYPAPETPSYANSAISKEKIDVYLQQIQHYFETSQAYLRPDLSLNVLEEELNIPKHFLSQLFNVHMGKSFYQYVAEYRVAYATKRMKEKNIPIKIESLAYECGFNSKTSFNRYFKNIVGCTPIEYLNQKEGHTFNQNNLEN